MGEDHAKSPLSASELHPPCPLELAFERSSRP